MVEVKFVRAWRRSFLIIHSPLILPVLYIFYASAFGPAVANIDVGSRMERNKTFCLMSFKPEMKMLGRLKMTKNICWIIHLISKKGKCSNDISYMHFFLSFFFLRFRSFLGAAPCQCRRHIDKERPLILIIQSVSGARASGMDWWVGFTYRICIVNCSGALVGSTQPNCIIIWKKKKKKKIEI